MKSVAAFCLNKNENHFIIRSNMYLLFNRASASLSMKTVTPRLSCNEEAKDEQSWQQKRRPTTGGRARIAVGIRRRREQIGSISWH